MQELFNRDGEDLIEMLNMQPNFSLNLAAHLEITVCSLQLDQNYGRMR